LITHAPFDHSIDVQELKSKWTKIPEMLEDRPPLFSDKIKYGAYEFQTIRAPGHSEDSFVLFEKKRNF
jgi:glyoxylase-like metal-dependent hydrolase (beta-lactamase superfamily II)